MSTTTTDFRWLTEAEQHVWRSWITATSLLQERLDRDMKAGHGLSMAEYEVLVRLSESPERRLRMSELANRTLASKSRLSHQISRMEDSGLVRREECSADRRGAFAVLTNHGWQTLVDAAPDHVTSVRTWLVEAMDGEEFRQLGELSARVVARLRSGYPTETG